jgi:GR25 family glycosyltransferase involved in LPS biosynthesis
MRRIVEAKAPFGLILEDDAVMSPLVNDRFLSEMTNLMIRNQLDILQIGFIEQYYAIYLRPGILEFIISLFKNRGKRDPTGFRFVLGEFRAGAHAYLVNARLADAFSKSCPEPPIIPWDDYLGNIAQGQLHRGIRIARLVKSVVSQASRSSEVMLLDSDIGG